MQALAESHLTDARPQAAAQLRRNDILNTSPITLQQKARASSISSSPRMAMQRKQLATLQRMGKEEELQPKLAAGAALQRMGKEEELQPKLASGAPLQRQDAKPNQTGMPDQLKSGIESLSGMSMDHVKVHYNSPQPAQLNALAYAQGSDIHVGPGQEQHVPHEAWHVVQQAQGRVQATTQMKEGTPVNDDPGLEHEADVMGAKAMALG